jgi:hypothetical protein
LGSVVGENGGDAHGALLYMAEVYSWIKKGQFRREKPHFDVCPDHSKYDC